MKRALSLLLALLMAASLVMPQAWAAGLQEPEPDAVVQQTQPDTAEPDAQLPQADTLAGNAAGLTPITRTKNAVASGVTLEKVVMRNVNGSQVVGYLSEIDLSKDVTLKASYTGYYYDGSTAAQRNKRVYQLLCRLCCRFTQLFCRRDGCSCCAGIALFKHLPLCVLRCRFSRTLCINF